MGFLVFEFDIVGLFKVVFKGEVKGTIGPIPSYSGSLHFTAYGKAEACLLFCGDVQVGPWKIVSLGLGSIGAPPINLNGHWSFKQKGVQYFWDLVQIGNTVYQFWPGMPVWKLSIQGSKLIAPPGVWSPSLQYVADITPFNEILWKHDPQPWTPTPRPCNSGDPRDMVRGVWASTRVSKVYVATSSPGKVWIVGENIFRKPIEGNVNAQGEIHFQVDGYPSKMQSDGKLQWPDESFHWDQVDTLTKILSFCKPTAKSTLDKYDMAFTATGCPARVASGDKDWYAKQTDSSVLLNMWKICSQANQVNIQASRCCGAGSTASSCRPTCTQLQAFP
eukprot:gnl/TRDRNA2_/TRDRNA2_208278_c0_seq1.p1 gnl/TRDRNA2_/TRDRNA2_208278_c0~~gnl/TRDRNA2_/TRDRNA2_208278_c0_seq1.p1  ORF type:complete len:363 (+),score=6.14 gnl/TRDRNA2_/TRDRNA2_208278_c0_seq1:92-1090(+)